MLPSQSPAIFTVSRLNQTVRLLLEHEMGQVWISGEISNFTQPASGHWYFTLKDDTAQVRCAMFRNSNRRVTFRPQHGQQVLVRANITLYEPRGDYQIIVESMQPAGEGLLQQKYEQLKAKLQAEGLFDQQYKKPLPSPAHCVGVITSKTGAALHDILHVLKRRDPSLPVIIYPAAVQGDDAPGQIVRAIELANQRNECDVLIVGRGGGSIEELWAFNEEQTVRAIAASEIPVVSAVGHETDFTLADFAADKRAATPSQAAEIVVADANAYINYVLELEKRCKNIMLKRLTTAETTLERLQSSWALANPQRLLESRMQRYDFAAAKLKQNFSAALTDRQHKCGVLAAKLDALSPLTVLARGYSVTENADGKVIRSIEEVRWGDEIITQVGDGNIISVVQHTEER